MWTDGSENPLTTMRRVDFLRVVRRARAGALQADASRRTLLAWAERLMPYLDRHPDWTLGDALEHYHADCATHKERRA